MKEGIGIAAVIVAVVFGFMVVSYAGLHWAGFLSKERETIRTTVHRESQSYTDGMRIELGRIKMEYDKADQQGRIGISAHVRDTYSRVDTSSYPDHLKAFLNQNGVTK